MICESCRKNEHGYCCGGTGFLNIIACDCYRNCHIQVTKGEKC